MQKLKENLFKILFPGKAADLTNVCKAFTRQRQFLKDLEISTKCTNTKTKIGNYFKPRGLIDD